ncbi:hypothetical protein BJV78DRAFT_1285721 [Lactifluus subvellereus]|nr:hypothetical protein BJV78DRAFT_1285721 [Lactifluus subvellereus]
MPLERAPIWRTCDTHWQAQRCLARYGRAMVAPPNETTQLLIEICTGIDLLVSEPNTLSTPSKPTGGGSYLSSTRALLCFISDSSPKRPRAPARSEIDGPRAPSPPSTVRAVPLPVKRPSPRLYFANFVGRREHLVVFLEAVALPRWGPEPLDDGPKDSVASLGDTSAEDSAEAADRQAVWNTLLELYLTLVSAAGNGARADALRDKAPQLLRAAERLPYDPTHVLILCAARSFTPGLVLLWERLGMHEDLYKLAWRFFTSAPELMARHTQDLAEALRMIKERAITAACRRTCAQPERGGERRAGGRVAARTHTDGREEDEQLTASYRDEAAKKLRQVEELSDPDHPRLFNGTQASTSGPSSTPLPLSPLSFAYWCAVDAWAITMQSAHSAYGLCIRAHGVIQEIRHNNERLADQHDLFLAEVKENGFVLSPRRSVEVC